MGHQGDQDQVVGLKDMLHIGYEPTYMFDLAGPEMEVLPLVILMVGCLS